MNLIKKKRGGRRKKGKKSNLQEGEDISFTEKETVVEEIRMTENVRECMGEGEDFDEKDVVSRVKLF